MEAKRPVTEGSAPSPTCGPATTSRWWVRDAEVAESCSDPHTGLGSHADVLDESFPRFCPRRSSGQKLKEEEAPQSS